MTDKKVNYTKQQTAELTEAYSSADSEQTRENVIEHYSQALNKTVRSIRQKLVREGIYIKKERTTKSGQPIERKAEIVNSIADLVGVQSDVIGSLEKSTAVALRILRDALVEQGTSD